MRRAAAVQGQHHQVPSGAAVELLEDHRAPVPRHRVGILEVDVRGDERAVGRSGGDALHEQVEASVRIRLIDQPRSIGPEERRPIGRVAEREPGGNRALQIHDPEIRLGGRVLAHDCGGAAIRRQGDKLVVGRRQRQRPGLASGTIEPDEPVRYLPAVHAIRGGRRHPVSVRLPGARLVRQHDRITLQCEAARIEALGHHAVAARIDQVAGLRIDGRLLRSHHMDALRRIERARPDVMLARLRGQADVEEMLAVG